MKINSITRKLKRAFIGVMSLVLIVQCKDPEIAISTSDTVNITGYLEKNPEEFSEFLKMLELTGNAGFLNAYGSYTCFAPTNAAIQNFLTVKGKTSLEDMDVEDLKSLVRFHLVEDTLSTSSFTDGKISRLTMHGQYLTTGAVNEDGNSYIRVNRQANITQGNIIVQNGIIHVINGVLEPTSYTLAQLIDQNPEYSIFKEALVETGFYDSLNTPFKAGSNTERRWITLIAQSNSVFAEIGINSYEDLRNKYSTKNNPKDPSDSLYLFVGYHILRDSKYIADLVIASSHETVLPLEVVTAKLVGQSVLINEDEYNGVVEPGSEIDRANSDYSATNGVLHSALQNFAIKVRNPIPIYWEVTDQPELRIMSAFRALLGETVYMKPGDLKDITWGKSTTNTISYSSYARNGGGAPWVNYDVLRMGTASNRASKNRISWIEFVTPLIAKGKYKFWLCSTDLQYNDIQFTFDGEVLPRIMQGAVNKDTPIRWPWVNGLLPESEAEAQGFKYFSPTVKSGNRTYFARLIGVIDVKTTDRHKLRFDILTDYDIAEYYFNLDMIQIIPIQNDQIWPKFNRDGSRVEKP